MNDPSGANARASARPGPAAEFQHRAFRIQGLAAWVLVPAVLGGLVFVQAREFREATCETFDEFTYLRMGISIFRYGKFFDLCSPIAPPLPILLEYWCPALRAQWLPESEGWELEVPSLIRQARLVTSVLVGMPLVWVIYAWLARRRGWLVGALGGGLAAFSPSLLAAVSVAATDGCFALFAVLALAAFHLHQVRPSRGSFAVAGVAMGLAMAAKQTAVFLVPVALVELLVASPGRRPDETRVDACLRALARAGPRLAALVAIAFVVDWALYGFTLGPPLRSGAAHAYLPVVVPMVASLCSNGGAIVESARWIRPPLAIDTFIGQVEHATRGQPAFLMGQHSERGWWYFVPVAIALKSTPPELLMIGLAAWLACRPRTWADPARRLWLTALAVMIGLGLVSALNIGHRYMIVIYPLIVLLAADAIGEIGARRPRCGAIVGALLLSWQAAVAIGIAPHYVSYFNALRGGPSEGYRYLVDSSLDWGQDLPSLRRELEARGYHKVALAYFGTARPHAYGLRSVPYWSPEAALASGCDFIAISATVLQGAYTDSSALKALFGPLPSIRVGYSIFLYDLRDPRVRAAVIHSIRRPPPSGGRA